MKARHYTPFRPKGGMTMKRKLLMLLALTVMMAMCATTALAELHYTPEVKAQRLAIAAMQDKYGFTLQTLGLFNPQITVAEEMSCVHFRCGFLPYSRVGEYTVLINGNRLSISWTYDDVDPALYQSGDPQAPCWGVKQLEAYLAVDSGARAEWLQPFYALGEQDVHVPASMWDTLNLTRLPEEEQKRAPVSVRAAAEDAILDVFGLSTDWFDARLSPDDSDALISPTGRLYYTLLYSGGSDFGIHVLVDAETCEIMSITPSSGGNG